MASEPTDLIREADAALDGITPGEWIAEYSKASGHCVIDSESRNCLDSVARTMHVCASADARFIAAAPDLVRRLRDALRAERKDSTLFENLYDEAQAELAERFANKDRDRAALVELIAARAEYDEARAALAEANATIERVRALADEWMGDGANPRSFLKRIAGMALRRAIEGPAT